MATPTAAAPETVSTDEVLSALDKALQALHAAEVDAGSTEKESIAALKAMLLFRIVSLSAATDRNRPDPRHPRHRSLARSLRTLICPPRARSPSCTSSRS